MIQPLTLGISACLLGRTTRYDGGHKQQLFPPLPPSEPPIQWLEICPESACGLPTPRPPMRLEGEPGNPRLVVIENGQDHSKRMQHWLRAHMAVLSKTCFSGFLLKSRSPSCGKMGVSIFHHGVQRTIGGSGLYAAALAHHFPGLPMAEETILAHPKKWYDFLEQCRDYGSSIAPLFTRCLTCYQVD
ncbi:MAG: DUF523 domain-containing protein [Magnetococcales bacterium]|nr:DUF523 domain-containing protein [Magnetococcales bacterium]